MPRPSPLRGAVHAVIPHQEVMAVVDAGTAATLDLLTTSRDPKWLDLERASPATPRASFLPWMLQARVASVSFKCFICMLQVFHIDVAKVDRDVVYVAMAIHVCCKRPFQMF
jgi:hypothetical protein